MIDHEPPVKRAVVKFEPGADLTAFPAYEEAKAMESRPLEDDDRAPSDAGAGGIDAGEPTSDRLARSPALESLDPRSPTYLYDLLESTIFAEDDGGDPDLWSLGFCVLWVHGLDVETLAAEQSLDLSTRTPCHLSEILDHQIEDGRGAVLLGASRRYAEIPTGRYFRLPY